MPDEDWMLDFGGACLLLLIERFRFDNEIVKTGGKYAMLFGVEA